MSIPRKTGTYEISTVAGEEVKSFVPNALPPSDPPLQLDGAMGELLRDSEEALGRLELAGEMVPSLDWFIYGFVRKEAVVSSQIEGTQASLVDLIAYEATQDSGKSHQAESELEVRDVCNYLAALEHARYRMNSVNGLPLSMRLLNETHALLMKGVRGETKMPGEIRKSQNWIGGTRPGNAAFVPPPPNALGDCLAAVECFIHDPGNDLPLLIRAGLLHVQFETIHPYLDGNGRIGRMLVTLLLEHWGIMSSPLLYLSLFFKRHRDEYYRRLAAVRIDGDWEGWIEFFLEAVAVIAREGVETAREIFALITADRARVLAEPASSMMAARLFEILPNHPVITVAKAMALLSTTRPTAAKAVDSLVGAGVLVEPSGRKRDRAFHYEGYLNLLKPGTEL